MADADAELSKYADKVASLFQTLMTACSNDSPAPVVGALSMQLAKAARELSQRCEGRSASRVRMDPRIPEAIAEFHAQAFAGHKSGALPDTIPEGWQ